MSPGAGEWVMGTAQAGGLQKRGKTGARESQRRRRKKKEEKEINLDEKKSREKWCRERKRE